MFSYKSLLEMCRLLSYWPRNPKFCLLFIICRPLILMMVCICYYLSSENLVLQKCCLGVDHLTFEGGGRGG